MNNAVQLEMLNQTSMFITYKVWNYTQNGKIVSMNETETFKNIKALLKRINREDYYAIMHYTIKKDKHVEGKRLKSYYAYILLKHNANVDVIPIIEQHLKCTSEREILNPIDYYAENPNKWLMMPKNSIVKLYGKYGTAHIQKVYDEKGLMSFMNKFKSDNVKSLYINSYHTKFQ